MSEVIFGESKRSFGVSVKPNGRLEVRVYNDNQEVCDEIEQNKSNASHFLKYVGFKRENPRAKYWLAQVVKKYHSYFSNNQVDFAFKMSQRLFPVTPESLLSATSAYLDGDGQELASKVLGSSRAEIVQTDFDNWNGGTYYYCLHIHISREDFLCLGLDNVQTIQGIILEKLAVFSRPHPNHLIASVSITPTLITEIRQPQIHYPQNYGIPDIILNFIALTEKRTPGTYVADTIIAQELELEIQDVRDWIDILESDEKVKTANSRDGHSALLTAKGRLFLKGVLPNLQVNTVSREVQHVTNVIINNGDGTVISGDVNAGRDFIGRDKAGNIN